MKSKIITSILCFGFLLFGISAARAVTLTVTKIADTDDGICDADCSLREAIATVPTGGVIQFSALFNSSQTITIVGGFNYLNVNRSMSVNGPGADKLTLSGSGQTKLFSVQTGASVTISGLKVTNGESGGATGNAGGIENFGNLTIDRCIITGNTGTSYAGGIGNFSGGSLTVLNSTISNNITNLSGASSGGGISSDGSLILVNSTVSGNTGNASSITAGGVLIFGGSATFINNTITNNTTTTSSDRASGIFILNFFTNGAVVLRNNIVAGNVNNAAIPDVARYAALGSFTSNGANLIGNVGSETTFTVTGDQTGTGAAPLNPRLAPLGTYGGIFPTHALLQTSTAINAGDNCVTNLSCASNNPPVALTTDQRGSGAPRKIGTFVDIGAFEQNVTFGANTALNGVVNIPYSFQITATRQTSLAEFSGNNDSKEPAVLDAPFAPTNFSLIPIAGQSLPTGLTLSSAGLISGTPTMPGAYRFTVLVTDTDGFSGTIQYLINIFVPTAANVSVAGRVSTADGGGIRNAIISLTDSSGTTRSVRANTFGHYQFDEVLVGETYVISVTSKRFTFSRSAQVIAVNEALTDIDFIAQE